MRGVIHVAAAVILLSGPVYAQTPAQRNGGRNDRLEDRRDRREDRWDRRH